MQKVSIIIPAKNEEGTIGLVLDEIYAVLRKINYEFEIIVIDDHSDDITAKTASSKGATVIVNNGKSGKGNALKQGFSLAKGDFIIMMDADYSHQAQDIPYFLQAFENGAGFVIGSRIYGGSEEYTRWRAFGNVFLTGVFGILLGRYLSDALNGFKGFRKDLIKNHKYESSNFEIEIELLAYAIRDGYKIVEISSHERMRKKGVVKSHIVRDGTSFLMRILKEWFRMKILHRL